MLIEDLTIAQEPLLFIVLRKMPRISTGLDKIRAFGFYFFHFIHGFRDLFRRVGLKHNVVSYI